MVSVTSHNHKTDSKPPTELTQTAQSGERPLASRIAFSLSAKLLWLTVAFVMIAEVLIFVPSVANFRKNWLAERLMSAQIAALAVEAAPDNTVPDRLRTELLEAAQVRAVSLSGGQSRRLILASDIPERVASHYDLTSVSAVELLIDALYVYVAPEGRIIRVVDTAKFRPAETVDVVMNEAPLKAAMVQFGINILILSIIISVITATLVYLSLNSLLVRPIREITRNMMRFRDAPEDTTRVINPSARSDEIGLAERELASMQHDLGALLRQKSRLAAVGLAVSKINHDLRNMLSSAQLISDRLTSLPDPTVQKFAPKLIASLDRAINLCTNTLHFGRAEEAPPQLGTFHLRALAEEVGESLVLPRDGICWRIDVPGDLLIHADRSQLFRVLSNLVRNACEAMEGHATGEPLEVRLAARRENGTIRLEVSDTGPGLTERARANLFSAFKGSGRKNGSGLGLAIAAELVRAHGGRIWLGNNEGGATFCIDLPDHAEATRERLSA
jgi:signal transduction histidine kinase